MQDVYRGNIENITKNLSWFNLEGEGQSGLFNYLSYTWDHLMSFPQFIKVILRIFPLCYLC